MRPESILPLPPPRTPTARGGPAVRPGRSRTVALYYRSLYYRTTVSEATTRPNPRCTVARLPRGRRTARGMRHPPGAEVRPGTGRTAALHHRSSASSQSILCQVHQHIRRLSFNRRRDRSLDSPPARRWPRPSGTGACSCGRRSHYHTPLCIFCAESLRKYTGRCVIDFTARG
jgi:hypothetical protein